MQAFQSDPHLISNVVSFDRPLLGDISGLNIIHLQCHIGTDTLSLARLGACSVTGLDFSGASIDEARRVAEATKGRGGEKLNFVKSSVYDGLNVLPKGTFDLVFTGIGALCWLHSIEEWAFVVSGLLKPGGRLFIREGHPVLWSLDEMRRDGLVVDRPYFQREDPVEYDEPGTYVEVTEHEWKATRTAEFNHGLGEIVQGLLRAGMKITGLVEHESVPYEAMPGQMMADDRGQHECKKILCCPITSMTDICTGEWSLKDRPWRLPCSYTLQAVKE